MTRAMKRGIVIHARGLRAAHIPRHAFRSGIRLLITCKLCQRKLYPSLTKVNRWDITVKVARR